MKHVDEYRDADRVQAIANAIREETTRPWTLMEVCGGQTHAIVRFGLDRLLPEGIELVHGPGCPVCVTPLEVLDAALAIAARPEVTFCTFGDMLRVPGSSQDLYQVKARGGDVRVVYSPLDALEIARKEPDREVVFFAVGFETTAPANALAAYLAREEGVPNFSLLVSHVLVPPAIEAVCSADDNRVQGFLAAGHVCTVMGYMDEYPELTEKHGVPIVVTGFEPVDVMHGILMAIRQLERGDHAVENQYARSVRPGGNERAVDMIEQVFEVVDRPWRGLGVIPRSGLALTKEYAAHDAMLRFDPGTGVIEEPAECIAGEILRGVKKPHECSAFGTRCTPERPLGAPMVSTEGACSAYHAFRRGAVPEGSAS
ncbi:MAG: hydrogenase formation protein HypD [Planctomycetota bacterium]